jgi:hypothetical protein
MLGYDFDIWRVIYLLNVTDMEYTDVGLNDNLDGFIRSEYDLKTLAEMTAFLYGLRREMCKTINEVNHVIEYLRIEKDGRN